MGFVTPPVYSWGLRNIIPYTEEAITRDFCMGPLRQERARGTCKTQINFDG
jgi:hypothetical protein